MYQRVFVSVLVREVFVDLWVGEVGLFVWRRYVLVWVGWRLMLREIVLVLGVLEEVSFSSLEVPSFPWSRVVDDYFHWPLSSYLVGELVSRETIVELILVGEAFSQQGESLSAVEILGIVHVVFQGSI
jgi:hypothetical protein